MTIWAGPIVTCLARFPGSGLMSQLRRWTDTW